MAIGPAGFDEAQVKLLLAGNDEEVGQAMDRIQRQLGRRIALWLGRRFPTMSLDDVEDVWADTLVCVLQALRKGTFQPERPLLPWIRSIARARAIDSIRREATRERTLVAARHVLDRCTSVEEATQGESTTSEVVQRVRAAILTLPARQRTVLQVFVDHYPETARMVILRDEVVRVTGTEISLAAVKRALQEGRRKLASSLGGQSYFPKAG